MVTMIRSDLDFILAQIKIAEADAAGIDIVATGLVPNVELPWGLRRVDGSNNNLGPGQGNYGAADQPFPHISQNVPPVNEGDDGMQFGPPMILVTVAPGIQIIRPVNFGVGELPTDFGFPDVPAGYIPESAKFDGTGLTAVSGGFTSPNGTFVPANFQPNFLANNNYGDHAPNDPAITDPRAIQPGDVVDADPRTISNLVVDQTANNPAAIYKALEVAGSADPLGDMWLVYQEAKDLRAAKAGGDPVAIEAAQNDLKSILDLKGITYEEDTDGDFGHATLVIPNVAPDAGLSSPFNGWMTLFGQFFDHGLDLVGKGGFGTVYVPLQPDDPLYVEGSNTNFMALTRSTLDENGNAINKVTPFVDQNQTYTSNASHQFFLREYELREGKPVATGRLLDGAPPAGGLASWADVKAQAKNILGIELNDADIHNVPEIVMDPYGNFIPDLTTGFPQLVRAVSTIGGVTVVTEVAVGNLATPAKTSEGSISTGHAFLDDIAHSANPGAGQVGDADGVIGITVTPNPAFNPLHVGPETFLLERTANVVINPNFDPLAGPGVGNAEYLRTNQVFDNELLDRHLITGDGRGNENIGLTAVHNVFHSEHNRQVSLIENLILGEAKDAAQAAAADPGNAAKLADAQEKLAFLNEWLVVDLALDALPTATTESVVWDGERVFQAAKFPTEMQYQHLVFEEFARTVQPFVNVFNDYNGQLDAAIVGEFAHTVYRFGHSMLNETVDRLTEGNQSVGTNGAVGGAQIGLIEAFLNPVEFTAGGMSAGDMTAAIARGMTRQVGNEIDEFVTEALRNNLVGLPLDLAALNIARGRETNVPTLNEARAQFYEGSGDTQVKPYESWADFAGNLKNPMSIVNFLAAYGTHASITGVTAMEAKRDAAIAIVFGGSTDPIYDDRMDFLHATGAYAGGSLGGLNNIDFWVGGLAEKQMAFGGMLGTTFNFVFEVQLENLQNGDRFYYLSRLANLNLTAQLENNKFAEMIDRNVDGLPLHLPGNVFKAMDYQLEVDQSRQFNAGANDWVDTKGTLDTEDDVTYSNAGDPTGSANGLNPILGFINGNTKVIRRDTDNDGFIDYLQFIGGEHVVFGGTARNDTLIGDEGDDTLWGDDGDDRIEGGIGNDFAFGGDGNDIITDEFGDDEIRSGAGDDVVSAGQGINLVITDTGRDFFWGGDDLDEALLGQGDDFGAGGADQDMIVGGEGNDWLESGLDNGLLLGDNGDLIQGLPIKRSVDSPLIGHDVLISTGGNADFDAESGDDIMVGGLGTDRFFGQFGFDWATYKNDPYGIEADMNLLQFAAPPIAGSPGALLDRYAQTESLSGSQFTDILRGDDETALAGGGAEAGVAVTPTGLDHALKDANVQLIGGLNAFLGNIDEVGENRYSAGNILLGGAGSDVVEGRGGNDLIDGDRWLDVQIEVRLNPGQTVMIDGVEKSGTFRVNGMSDVQEHMFSGAIKVAQLHIVREIKTDGADNSFGTDAEDTTIDVDVAQFSGPRADYDIVTNPDGSITITHLTRAADGTVVAGVIGADGVDRLTNIERLAFSDQVIWAPGVNTPGNPHPNVISGIAAGAELVVNTAGVLSINLAAIVDPDGAPAFDPETGLPVVGGSYTVNWQAETVPGSGVFANIERTVADSQIPVMGLTFTPTAAEAGLPIRAVVTFKDAEGAVEILMSPPTDATGGTVNVAPIFVEELAFLGIDLTTTEVDGALLDPNAPSVVGGALDRAIGIVEDSGPFTFTADDLLAFATEPNGTPMTVANVVMRQRPGDPVPGTFVTNLDGSFTFTPAENFNGGVIFSFDITDGVFITPAEANLEVFPLDDAPVPNAAVLGEIAADGPQTLTFDIEATLLANQAVDNGGRPVDIDGDRLAVDTASIQLVNPAQGTLTANGDGTMTFVPAPGFFGLVAVNFTLTDLITDVPGMTTLEVGRTFVGTGANNGLGSLPILGTGTRDVLDGAGGNDALSGLAGNDVLFGRTGNDTLSGGAGNDAIAAGIGTDQIVFAGGTGNFAFSDTGTSIVVTDLTGAEGTDTINLANLHRDDLIFNGTAFDIVLGNDIGNGFGGGTGLLNGFSGAAGSQAVFGLGGADWVHGGAGNDILVGGNGNDTLNGGADNDTIQAGDGDDIINQSAGHGRDIVDGGANATTDGDRYILTGTAGAESFNIYTRNAWLAVAGNDASQIAASSEIVITRNGAGAASIVAELDNIEEITVNTRAVSAGIPTDGSSDGDTINVFGNFAETSLNLNTITIVANGGAIDVTSLLSQHRVVVDMKNGPASIIGELRPQDVVVLPPGWSKANSATVNGVTTVTNGALSLSYTVADTTGLPPLLLNAGEAVPADTQDRLTTVAEAATTGDTTANSVAATSTDTTEDDASQHIVFMGGAGNDAAFGTALADRMNGSGGDDTLFGYDGDDSMVGDAGDDNIFAGAGNDVVTAGIGNDRVFADSGNDMVLGAAGDDVIDGGAGHDRLFGEQGNDTVSGGDGNDVIFARSGDGSDVFDGGDGIDELDYSGSEQAMVIDLGGGLVTTLAGEADVVRDIENVVGGRGNDTFYADTAANVLNGGGGNDTFVFRSAASANGDTIEGFQAGDRIDLTGIFGGPRTPGSFLDAGQTFNLAGQIRLVEVDGETRLEGNTDDNADVDFSILIEGIVKKTDII